MTKGKKAKKANGRPSKYKKEYDELARKFTLLGATNEDLAEFFEVNVDTIYEWKKTRESFSDAIKSGKEIADANVSSRLYSKAMGYDIKEEKVFCYEGMPVRVDVTKHYPPDTKAATFWLKNRQPARWRDKKEVEHSGEMTQNINYNAFSDEELEREIKGLMEDGTEQTE